MGNRKVIETYHSDLNNLADLLNKFVNSYRLLVGSAGELNQIASARKRDVKDALKMARELGQIIDEIIETLNNTGYNYSGYCKMKAEYVKLKLDENFVEKEIDEELNIKE